MYKHVAHFYSLQLDFLDNKCKFQPLWAVNFRHYNFLLGISKTHQQLSSSKELDIFDINQDQKYNLNQLIDFVTVNWKG